MKEHKIDESNVVWNISHQKASEAIRKSIITLLL